jgi:hypothetical protein
LRDPWQSPALFAIEAAVVMGLDRWVAVLPHAERLEDASPLPAGARRGSALRSMLVCIGVIALPARDDRRRGCALGAVLTGGWFGALGLARALSGIGWFP